MKRFQEYLNEKGKVQEKPIVDPKADTAKEGPKAPETPATSGKGWKGQPLTDKPKNYTPTTSPEKGKKGEKGFADEGDKKLVYEPKVDTSKDNKKVASWPKNTTEEFLEKTRDMNMSEFASFVSNQNKIEDQFPLGDFKKTTSWLSKEPALMETLVREFKRNGLFDVLVEEILKHQETYTELAYQMLDENLCRSFVQALIEVNETTDAPAQDTEVTADDLKQGKMKKRQPKTIEGQKMDFAGSDVNATKDPKGKLTPEHNLVNALLKNKAIFDIIKEKLG